MKGPARQVLVALAVAVARVPAQDPAGLVEQLASTDHRARNDAYQQLQRQRPPEALPLLAKRLPGMPLLGQSLGMYVLQGYPAADVEPVYRRFVEVGGPFLRGASAAALLRAGDRAAAATLAAAIPACDDQERSTLFGRMWSLDDPRVRDAVRGTVKAGSSANAVEDALFHLMNAGKGRDAATMQAARKLLDDATDVRVKAACGAYLLALGEGGHGSAVAAAIAKDDGAAARLRRFLDRAPALGPEIEDALVQRLAGARNAYEVTWPAEMLGKHAEDKAMGVLRELLTSKVDAVRKAALEALAGIPRGLQSGELRAMLVAEDPDTVLVAADAMRRMDDLGGLERVQALVAKAGTHRVAAVRALGQFRVRAVVPTLLDALADPDVQIRREAFSGLQRVLPALFPYRRLDLAATGYQPDASEDKRATGLAMLRAWWLAR